MQKFENLFVLFISSLAAFWFNVSFECMNLNPRIASMFLFLTSPLEYVEETQ